jgi:hypothetical protein
MSTDKDDCGEDQQTLVAVLGILFSLIVFGLVWTYVRH